MNRESSNQRIKYKNQNHQLSLLLLLLLLLEYNITKFDSIPENIRCRGKIFYSY